MEDQESKNTGERILRPLQVLLLKPPLTGPVDQYYLGLQYFNNVTLLNLDAQNIPEDLLCQILRQVGLGLAFLHSRNILHRNVHGNGILVNPRSQVKIMNLENAQYGPLAFGFYGSGYAPPEILWLKNFNIIPLYSFHDDVYSLGVVIFILIYGDFPYTKKGHVIFPAKPVEKRLRHLLESLLHRDTRSRMRNIKSFLEHGFFQRTKECTVIMLNGNSGERNVPLCVEETDESSCEESTQQYLKETEQHTALGGSQCEDHAVKSKKERSRNPFKKFIRKPAVAKRTDSVQVAEEIKEEKEGDKVIKGEQPSSGTPEVYKETSENPKKKKSLLHRIIRRMNFLRRRKVKNEKDKLVIKEKDKGSATHEFQQTSVKIQFPYELEKSPIKDFTDITIGDIRNPEEMEEVHHGNEVQAQKHQLVTPSNSSSFNNGSSKIVSLLKGFKLQEKCCKLSPVTEEDEGSDTQTAKLALPSHGEVSRLKKEKIIEKTHTAHRFHVTFEEFDETPKSENAQFDPFNIKTNWTETKDPWELDGEKKISRPLQQNTHDSHLDCFDSEKNWFSDIWPEQPSINNFDIWQNSSQVGTLNKKDAKSCDNCFTDAFIEQPYTIKSDSQTLLKTVENNKENETSSKPVKKHKNPFNWICKLFKK